MLLQYLPTRSEHLQTLFHLLKDCDAREQMFLMKHCDAVCRLWSKLLEEGTMLSGIVRMRQGPIMAFGSSVFVTDAFSEYVRFKKPSHMKLHLMQRWLDGDFTDILDFDHIREANSGEGLNVLLAYHGWDDVGFTEKQLEHIRTEKFKSLVMFHQGYCIKQILTEASDEKMRDRAQGAGLRLISDRGKPSSDGGSALHLLGCTRDEVQEGTLTKYLFIHVPPRFYFTPLQQEVLLRAVLFDQSDVQIADELCVSVYTVRQRWGDVYSRVEEIAPSLFPEEGLTKQRKCGEHGPKKRDIIKSYLRYHPEEMRPVLRPQNLPCP